LQSGSRFLLQTRILARIFQEASRDYLSTMKSVGLKDQDSFIERGVREGWLTPAKRPFKPLPPRKPVPGLTLEQLLADLDRDREDRW